jgi:hypothetical protein
LIRERWGNKFAAMRKIRILAALSGVLVLAIAVSQAQEKPASNVIEALQQELDAGAATLPFADDGHGYVPGLLAALHIPRDSQLLIFSASSLQFDRIAPSITRTMPRWARCWTAS